MHAPALAPMVPRSLPPVSGSDVMSSVRPRLFSSMEPIPEVNVPRYLPPRGYSGMEAPYDTPCDEYIADIELKRKKPVHPITGKPESWFSIIKSRLLGKSDSPHAPLLLGKRPSRTKHTTKSDEVVLRPSAQATDSWRLLPPEAPRHNRRTCILPAYYRPTGTLHIIKASRRGTCANLKHATFLLNEWKVLEVLRRKGRKRTPYLQGPSKEVDLWAWKDEKALYHVTVRGPSLRYSSVFLPPPKQPPQDFCEMGDLSAWATHLGENRMMLVAVELVRPSLWPYSSPSPLARPLDCARSIHWASSTTTSNRITCSLVMMATFE